jgi:hypothetical protein
MLLLLSSVLFVQGDAAQAALAEARTRITQLEGSVEVLTEEARVLHEKDAASDVLHKKVLNMYTSYSIYTSTHMHCRYVSSC